VSANKKDGGKQCGGGEEGVGYQWRGVEPVLSLVSTALVARSRNKPSASCWPSCAALCEDIKKIVLKNILI
jgi:hypothetical protein